MKPKKQIIYTNKDLIAFGKFAQAHEQKRIWDEIYSWLSVELADLRVEGVILDSHIRKLKKRVFLKK